MASPPFICHSHRQALPPLSQAPPPASSPPPDLHHAVTRDHHTHWPDPPSWISGRRERSHIVNGHSSLPLDLFLHRVSLSLVSSAVFLSHPSFVYCDALWLGGFMKFDCGWLRKITTFEYQGKNGSGIARGIWENWCTKRQFVFDRRNKTLNKILYYAGAGKK